MTTKSKTATQLPEWELIRRVRIAGEQLDKEPGGRLGWLVRFVGEDPTKWLPADQEGHGYRLLACGWEPLPSSLVSFGPDPDRMRAPMTPADVLRFHQELRAWFRRLVTYRGDGPGVPVPADGYSVRLVRATRPGVKPAIFGLSRGGPFRTMLYQRAARWIVDTGQLIACRECRKPTLALRRRLFCSAECLQIHHDRKKISKRRQAVKAKGGSA